jgi:hypothetical protein
MSVLAPTSPTPPPVTNNATAAATQYLLARRVRIASGRETWASGKRRTRAEQPREYDAEEDGWNHLIGILFQATGNLFLPATGFTLVEATRQFFELWLSEWLAPYLDLDEDAINDAAEHGAFRYLGRHGRNALIDEIRKRTSSTDALDQHLTEEEWFAGYAPKLISIDQPGADDDDPTLENEFALNEDAGYVSPLGCKPGIEADQLRRELDKSRDVFSQLLGGLHGVLLTVCDLFPEELRKGTATKAIAAARHVSVQTGRKLLRKLRDKLATALKAGDPDVRGLFTLLQSSGGATFRCCEEFRRGTGKPTL